MPILMRQLCCIAFTPNIIAPGTLLILLGVCAMATAAPDATPPFAAVDVRVQEDVDANGDQAGDYGVISKIPRNADRMVIRTFSFGDVTQPYKLRWLRTFNADQVQRTMFGISEPGAGYYRIRTFSAWINGESVWDGEVDAVRITDPEPAVQLTFAGDYGQLTLRIQMRKQAELMRWTGLVTPADGVQKMRVRFTAYPGAMAKSADDRARMVVTPGRHVPWEGEGRHVKIADDAQWALLTDQQYNLANNTGVGPTVIAWQPGPRARVRLTNYAVQPYFDFDEGRTRFTFYVGEMPERTLSEAEHAMRAKTFE